MQIQPGSRIPIGAIQNSKAATVFLTLGLQLQRPGIYISLDRDHPNSSGGVANFLFESNLGNSIHRYLELYNENTSDVALDQHLAKLRAEGHLTDAQLTELETKIAESLLTWGHKILDNYQLVVRTIKNDVAKYAITGGEPVYSNTGAIAGIQNFNISRIK